MRLILVIFSILWMVACSPSKNANVSIKFVDTSIYSMNDELMSEAELVDLLLKLKEKGFVVGLSIQSSVDMGNEIEALLVSVRSRQHLKDLNVNITLNNAFKRDN